MTQDYGRLKRKFALEILNRCGHEYTELPIEAWNQFKHFKYKDLIAPLVKGDSKKGHSLGMLMRKYRRSQSQIRHILKSVDNPQES